MVAKQIGSYCVCGLLQCSQCKDQYIGTPTDGHQCYLRAVSEQEYCITRSDVHSICSTTEPLRYGYAVMYAVLPKYLNVNIKIYVNIHEGGV